ncbi:uncharacterized protein MELLADRAFT_114775 [Melampsora larici-populina 98AG31]|uniref:Uncharacterized protein n=1 Tax=Melampsora larici-populina (strain 98AG31 / pathotype 3-4-7) TaxID=747676 RepID=F4R323_MELLP|nr:uncharacterized protein MELLADRAFT_114775 [Melampsora larici-populina 98AG31]EGG12554.1 hypothetical protein MELLADRAFT_114775 [Melampsora larici-populina 98AG31]
MASSDQRKRPEAMAHVTGKKRKRIAETSSKASSSETDDASVLSDADPEAYGTPSSLPNLANPGPSRSTGFVRGATPILTTPQATLLQGKKQYIERTAYIAQLERKLKWITDTLEEEKCSPSFFDALQESGRLAEVDLMKLANGTFQNNLKSLFHVTGLLPPLKKPIFDPSIEEIHQNASSQDATQATSRTSPQAKKRKANPAPPRPQLDRAAKGKAIDEGSSAGSTSTPRAKRRPPRTPSQTTSAQALGDGDETPSPVNSRASPPTGSRGPTPRPHSPTLPRGPPDPTPPRLDVKAIEEGYHTLINEITDLSALPSTLKPMRVSLDDPFFAFFSSSMAFPTKNSNAPLLAYLNYQFDKNFPRPQFREMFPRGERAYTFVTQFFNMARLHEDWTPVDTMGIMSRIQAIRDNLKRAVIRDPPVAPLPKPPLASPTTSAPEDTAKHTALFHDNSTNHPDNDMDLDGDPVVQDDHTLATGGESLSDASIGPDPPLPADQEELVAAIEKAGKLPSNIPLGHPEDVLARYFSGTFFLPEDVEPDDAWPYLDGELNVKIGKDTFDTLLRVGPHGIDGLIRGWLVRSHRNPAWNVTFDWGTNVKLGGIKEYMAKKVKVIMPNNHAPPATQSVTTQLTPSASNSAGPSDLDVTEDSTDATTASTSLPLDAPPTFPEADPSHSQAQADSPATQPRPLQSTAEREDTNLLDEFLNFMDSPNAQPNSPRRDSSAPSALPVQATTLGSALPPPNPPTADPRLPASLSPDQSMTMDPRLETLTALPAQPQASTGTETMEITTSTHSQSVSGVEKSASHPPRPGQTLGSLPINPDVRIVGPVEKEPTTTIWKVSDASGVMAQSVRLGKIVNEDVPSIFTAVLRLLALRRRSSGKSIVTAETPVDVNFKVEPDLNAVEWLSHKSNKAVLLPSDSLAHCPEIFDLTMAIPGFKTPHQEEKKSSMIRGMLTQFVKPTPHNLDLALKSVLAAVAYANMDSSALITTTNTSDLVFPSKTIKNGLQAAVHFHKLQAKAPEEVMIACVKTLWELQNQIYGMVEAIASIRARIRHNQHVLTLPVGDRERLNAEYDALIKHLGTGSLPAKTLGPLVGFLVGGFRGLLVFSKNEGKFGPVKVSYCAVVINDLQEDGPVEESIWKHTQCFIMDLIESSLFPQGFESALGDPDNVVNEDQWQHANCNKMQLAKCIQMDLGNFFKSHALLQADVPYKLPEFKLPTTTVNKPLPQKKKKKTQAAIQN